MNQALPMKRFKGKISIGSFNEKIEFSVHAGEDCRLVVDEIRVSASGFTTLHRTSGRPGEHASAISLEGKCEDGTEFKSSHMELGETKSSNDGHYVNLRTGEASVILYHKGDSDSGNPCVKVLLRGFKSFRPNPVNSSLGTLVVQGERSVKSEDEVSGAIIVQCSEADPDESWYDEAEALVDFVWRGLQFGHGGRLHVPVLEVYRRSKTVATFYNGKGRPSHLPVIDSLDQSEFIATLVARFESKKEFPDAIWQAVGWLNNDSSIDEVRYITLMTAIETVLDSLVPNSATTIIPKAKYKPISKKLVELLETFDIDQTSTEILSNSIRGINRASFSTKLDSVIDKYQLPRSKYNKVLIRELTKQRISIVHTGRASDPDKLWECLLYARELIVHIVLSELGYRGRHPTYAGGYEQSTMEHIEPVSSED